MGSSGLSLRRTGGPIIYAQLHRIETALSCLEWAVDLPGVYANIYVAHNAGLAPLKGEPRYHAALEAMGLRSGVR